MAEQAVNVPRPHITIQHILLLLRILVTCPECKVRNVVTPVIHACMHAGTLDHAKDCRNSPKTYGTLDIPQKLFKDQLKLTTRHGTLLKTVSLCSSSTWEALSALTHRGMSEMNNRLAVISPRDAKTHWGLWNNIWAGGRARALEREQSEWVSLSLSRWMGPRAPILRMMPWPVREQEGVWRFQKAELKFLRPYLRLTGNKHKTKLKLRNKQTISLRNLFWNVLPCHRLLVV